MFDLKTLLILVLALPLAAALATFAFGPRLLRGRSHAPVVVALVLSFVVSMMLIFQVRGLIDEQPSASQDSHPLSVNSPLKKGATAGLSSSAGNVPRENTAGQASSGTRVFQNRLFQRGVKRVYEIWSWASVPDAMPTPDGESGATAQCNFNIGVSLRADPLTAVMLAMVTCISALVAIYSIGYMRGDAGYWRFFAYIGLFVFSMNLLVSASNFLLLYVGWELVGLCSYLLIGFWYEKPAAAAAGKKAFLVNRIGDVGFALGIFLIWTTFGTLDFGGVLSQASEHAGDWRITAICLLLFCGACGKSAQFPLHVWLPDAMEGPTPVSALIHAATMVTAGVYMVARCTPLFAEAPDAQHVVAVVGGVTALLGAIIAITQTDLKRVLAYSTISHLGYMFVAAGTLFGATVAIFHMVTHAFFKALLFLGAGSIMHAAGGVIDIRRLGGLRRRLPITYWVYLIGCLSIAGIVPFSGFWSKEEILFELHGRSAAEGGIWWFLFLSTLLGVVLIDFYIFRPFFIVFYGEEKIPPEAGGHIHESPPSMTVPLVVLAFGSAVVGAYFEWTHGFASFLAHTPSFDCLRLAEHQAVNAADKWRISLFGSTLSILGIGVVAAFYLRRGKALEWLTRTMNIFGLYSLSYGKFFIDPIYNALIVRPLLGIARLAAWFDRSAIDATVDFWRVRAEIRRSAAPPGAERAGAVLRPGNGFRSFDIVGNYVDVATP